MVILQELLSGIIGRPVLPTDHRRRVMKGMRLLIGTLLLGMPTANLVAQTPGGITVQFDAPAYERIESVGKFKVKIQLSQVSPTDVKVKYATADSDLQPKAKADVDYVKIAPTQIIIRANTNPPEAVIEVEIKNNNIAELN